MATSGYDICLLMELHASGSRPWGGGSPVRGGRGGGIDSPGGVESLRCAVFLRRDASGVARLALMSSSSRGDAGVLPPPLWWEREPPAAGTVLKWRWWSLGRFCMFWLRLGKGGGSELLPFGDVGVVLHGRLTGEEGEGVWGTRWWGWCWRWWWAGGDCCKRETVKRRLVLCEAHRYRKRSEEREGEGRRNSFNDFTTISTFFF